VREGREDEAERGGARRSEAVSVRIAKVEVE